MGLFLLCGVEATHAVAHRKFDFVVGVDGDFKAASAAAAAKASASNRFYLFFPDGEYDLGTQTGDANQKTNFSTANVSFIGQSEEKTVLFNKSINEGIGITATLYLNKADNLYMQDMTIKNKANYGDPATYSVTGRHVAIQEQANKVVYKNVRLLSTQDTYYTKGTRTYWEGGQIHGTTDFICGGGDVFFHKVLLYEMKKSAMIAPSTNTSWGYVFKDCTIDGDVSGFDLGRSWGDARAVFLNTTMRKLPSATGWGNPMNSVPKVFAEYKSIDASGNPVDLSQRRRVYTKDAVTVTLDPVLSDAEAAKYSLSAVLGGNDNWQPQNATKQVAAPVIAQEGSTLRWADQTDALCWVVFRNGRYFANVATNSIDISPVSLGEALTVRAANAMGGLGASSNTVTRAASNAPALSLTSGASDQTLEEGEAIEPIVYTWGGTATGVQATDLPSGLTGVANGKTFTISGTPTRAGTFTISTQQPSGTAVTLQGSILLTPAIVFKLGGIEHCEADGVPESSNPGAEQGTYLNPENVQGSMARWAIQASAPSSGILKVRFANGGASPRPMTLTVNGSAQGTFGFANQGDWTVWRSEAIDISLATGINRVVLTATSADGGPNIDWIGFSGQSLSKGACDAVSSSARPAREGLRVASGSSRMLRISGLGAATGELSVVDVAGMVRLRVRLAAGASNRVLDLSGADLDPGIFLVRWTTPGHRPQVAKTWLRD